MKRRPTTVIALLSASLLALEVIWTRLFSAEFYYTFAFLTLSLAILGLGLGALLVRIWPRLASDTVLPVALVLTAVSMLAGPPLVFWLAVDFSLLLTSWALVGKFVLTVALLGAAFFFGGIALASLLRGGHREVARLYMADLLGAGLGVVAAVVAMDLLGTPVATFAAALPVLVAAHMTARHWGRLAPALTTVTMVVLAAFAARLLELKRSERAPVIYTHWDAMAKVKVLDFGEARTINIDNAANSTAPRFDGDFRRAGKGPLEFGIDVGYLIKRMPSCRFLSLGAGAGQDVLQALYHGADEVHAVEVNGHINRMMLVDDVRGYRLAAPPTPAPATADKPGATATPLAVLTPTPAADQRLVSLAEFSGQIYRDPRVRVVTEDARSYIGRFDGELDLIYSLSSNTFAALSSGSFALAENYLFTTEAFRTYWRALSPRGFMTMEHQFYMPRLVGSLLDALKAEGVADPTQHFAVYDLPKLRRNLLLISRQPLDEQTRQHAFGELTPEVFEHIHLLFPPAKGLEDNLIARIVRSGWQEAAPTAKVNIAPTTDNAPFVGQMGLWRNLKRENLKKIQMIEVNGFPLSKVMILAILAIVVVLLVPLNLLPYARPGARLRAVPWLYFFTIGAAFMAIEVVLIQKLTLLVGPAFYSITVVLLTLLLASGIGSRMSARTPDWLPFVAIAGWLLIDAVLGRIIIGLLSAAPMGWRLAAGALLVMPLGFFMGMPFPKAALRVGELVDWGFAVNGAASVLGAAGILLVAFEWGINAALLLGAGLYLVALALFAARASWRVRSAPVPPAEVQAANGA
jgi:hypothetical protein